MPDLNLSNAPEPGRARWLRAVERLRAGLPPAGATARTSVGVERLLAGLRQFLTERGESSIAYLIQGDYGNGKTHALMLLRDMAHEAGFATAWLNADASQGALNHPQRFLPGLLASLETPMGDSGYSALLTRLLEDPERAPIITQLVRQSMTGYSQLERRCGWHALSLELSDDPSDVDEQDADLAERDELVRLLVGETLVGRSASDLNRSAAYLLLGIAVRAVEAADCLGLVVIIDELESVLFKLPNIRSRHGAYRTLAALIHGIKEPGLRVAMAVTPDASSQLGNDIAGVAGHYWALPAEPVRKLSRSLGDGSIASWACHPLTDAQLEDLLERIRELYTDAHPQWRNTKDSEWQRKVAEVQRRQPAVRIAAREAIDFMDWVRHEAIANP